MRLNNNKGSLLVISLWLVVILVTLGTAFILMSINEGRTAERQRLLLLAFHNAEAGVSRAVYDLRQDFLNDLSSPSWADGDINAMLIGPDTVDFYAVPYSGTALNSGSYSVELKNVGSRGVWIRATGTASGVTQRILVYARIYSISPWNNAIFAGEGDDPDAGATIIHGNVNIAGSVHILGTGLTATDYAVELGGTAELIGNNYEDLDSDLKRRVPALPTVNFNGENVETLNAQLRVKRGRIGLDGNSSVGRTDGPGDAYKETVDGVFVNDGFSGNGGTANVHSDNGWSNSYDLADTMTFPSLTTAYGGYASYTDYLYANALVISDAPTLTKLAGLTSASGSDFTASNANGSITKSGGNLTVSGIVYVDGGNLDIGGSGTITYTGQGAIYVTGNVTINTNFVTPAVAAGGEPNFPRVASTGQKNIIGIMTPNNITLGTSAQIDVMGLFYGESTVTINKQTDLVGTVVTNYFDLTGQVPNIFQVPDTANYLPPGMIGSDSSWQMEIVSWQKI